MADSRDNDPPMPAGPVDDPACWSGAEMQRSQAWIHRLDAGDFAEVDAAVARIEAAGRDFLDLARADFDLPLLAPKLARVRHAVVDGPGFALIRGLPLARLTRRQAALAFWGIGLHLGLPVAQNARGHLLGHVRDIGHTMTDPNQRGYASAETLRYHIDECDVVGLLCLQPAKWGGVSTIASSIALHNAIMEERPDLLRTLYRPYFVDRRGEVPAGAKPYFPMPIFAWHRGRVCAWLEPQYTTSSQRFDEVPRMTDRQWEAMHLMERLADDPRFRLDMEFRPGDIQFLNNHVIVHSRTQYQDHPEPGRRRHLLRLWLDVKDCRPLPRWQAERYGPRRRGGIGVPGMVPVAGLSAE